MPDVTPCPICGQNAPSGLSVFPVCGADLPQEASPAGELPPSPLPVSEPGQQPRPEAGSGPRPRLVEPDATPRPRLSAPPPPPPGARPVRVRAAVPDAVPPAPSPAADPPAASATGMCPGCGAKLPAAARFCSRCGAKAPSLPVHEDAAPAPACPACGAPVPPEAQFCPACGASRARAAMAGTDPAPSSPDASDLAVASIGRRFLAMIMDGVLLNLLLAFPSAAMMQSLGMTPEQGAVAATAAIVFWCWLYFALFESSRFQATPGKRAMGIVVTDLAGRRISLGRASLRYVGKILSGLILMLGFVMAFFSPRKQALHDRLAATLVLRAQPEAVRPRAGQTKTVPASQPAPSPTATCPHCGAALSKRTAKFCGACGGKIA